MTPAGPDRKSQILDAASVVFARLGFAPARMDDVASESGLSKGALYLYFRSKDELIDALVGRMVDLETRRLAEIRSSEGTASERLARFVAYYVAELERIAPLAPIVMEVYARAMRHRMVREVMQRYLVGFRAELAALVADGIARGEFASVDPDTVAVALTGLLEGLGLLWLLDRERVQLADAAQAGLHLMLAGLRPALAPNGEVTP